MPGVQVGTDAVATPENNIFGMCKTFRVNAAGGPVGQYPGRCRPLAAECALTNRRAQLVEKSITTVQTMYQSLVSEVTVRGDSLGAIFVDDVFPAADYFIQRLIPGDAFELFTALRAGPAQGVENAIRMVMAFLIIIEFYTQTTPRHGMIRVAVHTGEFAVLNFEDHGTGIGTIMRATAVISFFQLCSHGNLPSR